MKIPEQYMEQARRAEAFLEDALETADVRFERAIKNLQKRVIEIAARLEQLPDGTMKGGRFALSQALELEPQLRQLFEDTYGRAVADHIKDFDRVVGIIRDQFEPLGIPESFITGPTKDMLQALAAQADAALTGLGELARNQVAQAVYDSVLAGKPFSSLVDDIMNALTGLEDRAGRPLARYAKTFAQDSMMEVYGRAHKMGADRAGLQHYLYFGTTVRDTRPFCSARVGKVFTREEVEGWEGMTWRGKKPGSIWATRGGYNCRHQLLGVKPEWVEDDLRGQLGIEEVQQPMEKPEPRKKPGKKPASMSNDDNLAKYVVVE